MMKNRICNLNEFASDTVELPALARMVIQALPDFYGMIPLSPAALLDLIVDEMHIDGTECYNPFVALVDETQVGVICAYPLAELASRQQGSLLQIMRKLDRSGRREFRDMATRNASIAAIESDNARYIARLTVANGMRGQGLGKQIFAEFAAIEPDRPIALHVDRGNDSAIGYYRRLGFDFAGPSDVTKLAMIWHRTAGMAGSALV